MASVFGSFYLKALKVLGVPSVAERARRLISERRDQIFKDLWQLYKEKDVRGRAIKALLQEALYLKMDVISAVMFPEDEPWLTVDVPEFVSHLKKEFNPA